MRSRDFRSLLGLVRANPLRGTCGWLGGLCLLLCAQVFPLHAEEGLAPMVGGSTDEAWSLGGAAQVWTVDGWITAIDLSRDGHWLAIGTRKQVQVVDLIDKQVAVQATLPVQQVHAVAWSADARKLFVGGYQRIYEIDPTSGKVAKETKAHRGQVMALALSPNGLQLASTSDDETAAVWTLPLDKPTWKITQPDQPLLAVAWSSDGTMVATAGGDETRVNRRGRVTVRDSATGTELFHVDDHKLAATAVTFTANDTRLVTAGLDEKANVYELPGGQPLGFFGGHSRPINSLAVHPDGKTIVSGSGGKFVGGHEVIAWLHADGHPLARLSDHEARVSAVKISADASQLVTASYDGTVRIYALPSPAEEKDAAGGDSPPVSALSPANVPGPAPNAQSSQ